MRKFLSNVSVKKFMFNIKNYVDTQIQSIKDTLNPPPRIFSTTIDAEFNNDNEFKCYEVQDISGINWLARPIVIVSLADTSFLGSISSVFWRDGYVYFNVIYNNAQYKESVLVDIIMFGNA